MENVYNCSPAHLTGLARFYVLELWFILQVQVLLNIAVATNTFRLPALRFHSSVTEEHHCFYCSVR